MPRTADDDFLALLAAAQLTLSPKMAQVAAYFHDYYDRAAFLSTREIAAAAGVSLATMVRFPRELGYPDVAALLTAIQDRLRVDIGGVQHFRSLPTTNRSGAALFQRILETDVECLQALARSFSEPQLAGLI